MHAERDGNRISLTDSDRGACAREFSHTSARRFILITLERREPVALLFGSTTLTATVLLDDSRPSNTDLPSTSQ